MSNILRVAIVILVLTVSACDPAYPLFLRNGLDTEVTIVAEFSGNTSNEVELQPGERLGFFHVEGDIQAVTVLVAGRILYSIDRQGLEEMARLVPNPRKVTWNIESEEIKPLSTVELRSLESKASN